MGEDFPGWITCQQVALSKECDSNQFSTQDKIQDSESDDIVIVSVGDGIEIEKMGNIQSETLNEIELPDGEFAKVYCASRGYYVYRQTWRPKLNEKLVIHPE